MCLIHILVAHDPDHETKKKKQNIKACSLKAVSALQPVFRAETTSTASYSPGVRTRPETSKKEKKCSDRATCKVFSRRLNTKKKKEDAWYTSREVSWRCRDSYLLHGWDWGLFFLLLLWIFRNDLQDRSRCHVLHFCCLAIRWQAHFISPLRYVGHLASKSDPNSPSWNLDRASKHEHETWLAE